MNNCNLCDLCKYSCPSCIRGSGPRNADIMIVNSLAGDADEEHEEATMDGHTMTTLAHLDYPLKDIYYTNAIKCRTPKGYKIKVSELKKCRVHLLEEIKRIKPKWVLLLGAQACQAALDMKISELQGTPYERDGVNYFATYSPRVMYYDAAKADQVNRELKEFLSLAKGKMAKKLPKLNRIVITSIAQAKKCLDEYEDKYTAISYDIESTGLDRWTDKITLFGFGNRRVQYQIPLNVNYSPLQHKPLLQKRLMRYVIKRIQRFEDQVAANGKFDDLFLEFKYKIKPHITFDVNLASHLIDENTPNGLKDSAVRDLGAPNWDIGTDQKKGKVNTKEEYEEFLEYNGYDIYYTDKLFIWDKKQLKDQSLWNIFTYLTMPLAQKYEQIEKAGIPINMKSYNRSKNELTGKLTQIEKDLHDLIPDKLKDKYADINWNSDKQVRELLFDDMGLEPLDLTPTGLPQVNESVLIRLKTDLTDKLVEHRGVSTQIQTFVNGWGDLIKPDGKVHPSFKIDGTVTGRMSCKKPNLQQLPRDPEVRCWVDSSDPEWTFLAADYSQLELRGTAIVSGDRRMTELFKNGVDIHTNTGQTVTGKQELTKEERKKAKAVNFGFVYGMGWRKFKIYARDNYGVKLDDKESKEFREKFFNEYVDLPPWHDRQKKIVRYLGQVKNPIGRIRHLPDINSKDESKVAEAERQAINSPVQGFGADIAGLALIELMETIPPDIYYPVGTVHDSIEGMCRTEYVECVAKKLTAIMASPKNLKKVFKFETEVPILADLEIGPFGKGVELDEWLANNKVPQKKCKFKKFE